MRFTGIHQTSAFYPFSFSASGGLGGINSFYRFSLIPSILLSTDIGCACLKMNSLTQNSFLGFGFVPYFPSHMSGREKLFPGLEWEVGMRIGIPVIHTKCVWYTRFEHTLFYALFIVSELPLESNGRHKAFGCGLNCSSSELGKLQDIFSLKSVPVFLKPP